MDDLYEIIDNIGVIYSGTELEMRQQWEEMVDGNDTMEWQGDLKLIKIISIIK